MYYWLSLGLVWNILISVLSNSSLDLVLVLVKTCLFSLAYFSLDLVLVLVETYLTQSHLVSRHALTEYMSQNYKTPLFSHNLFDLKNNLTIPTFEYLESLYFVIIYSPFSILLYTPYYIPPSSTPPTTSLPCKVNNLVLFVVYYFSFAGSIIYTKRFQLICFQLMIKLVVIVVFSHLLLCFKVISRHVY